MVEARTKSKSADPTRISINDDDDVRRWAVYFGISEAQLKTVVHVVGPMVPDVRKEIEQTP